jgi:mono/diheme cytochrome c family protein
MQSFVRVLFIVSVVTLLAGLPAIGAHAQEGSDVYQPPSMQPPASGKADFMRNCASCHGKDGRGHGPDVQALGIKPSDLSAISLRNGGVFPYQKVEDDIDGRKSVPGHKRFDMPFWGTTMQVSGQEFTPASEAQVKARIDAIVNYIESIQRQ